MKTLFVLAMMFASVALAQDSSMLVYFGTVSNAGIYVSRFNSATGKLEAPTLAGKAQRPSFLVIDPANNRLYSTCVIDAKGDGGVSAFNLDRATGKLTFINSEDAKGRSTAFVGLDHTGKFLLFANYGSGSGGVMAIEENGGVGKTTAYHQHSGKSVNPKRQEGPHVHSFFADPANKHVLECDLGLDKIFIYDFDAQTGKLSDERAVSVAPGSGPRHLTFSRDGKFVYVINELGDKVIVFSYDSANGTMKELQTISTIPADFKGENYCSEVLLHPSGKFLYGANRGHDSIAVFAVDENTGLLSFKGDVPSGGKFPRNFGLSPDGKWMIVANEHSSDVAVFAIDQATGGLTPTGQTEHVEKPACVRFLQQ